MPEISLKDTASTIPFFSNIPEQALSGLMEKAKILNYVKKKPTSGLNAIKTMLFL